eukprot:6945069-Pyramimonas_sp.AAC.1
MPVAGIRAPIVEGEREYACNGHQSRKGRENIRTLRRMLMEPTCPTYAARIRALTPLVEVTCGVEG